MEDNFVKNLIIYEHKKLIFAGVVGMMKENLSNAGPLIKNKYSDIEVSPIQFQPRRDFLALFGYNPVLDITLDQYSPLENSIVGYALNKDGLLKRMSEISTLIEFVPYPKQDPRVKLTWEKEFEIEKSMYSSCETIAKAIKQPLEKAFGLVRYNNFLVQYMDKSEEAAQKISAQKFEVTLV